MRKALKLVKDALKETMFTSFGSKQQRQNSKDTINRFETSGSVQEVLQAESGTPLDDPVRTEMESQFGHDFSKVRIHTDARAVDSSQKIGADAYSFGEHIVFGSGQYTPHTPAGKALLAHELTHVIQHGGDATAVVPSHETLPIAPALDHWEHEANKVAAKVYDGSTHLRSGLSGERKSGWLNGREAGVPSYLQNLFAKGKINVAQYETSFQSFRKKHSNESLIQYQSMLGESGNHLQISKHAPLQQVRRFARAPKQEEENREELLRNLPGDDEMVIEVLTFFYPNNPPAEVNERLRNLSALMLWEAIQASRTMDLVPRPPGGRPGFGWLINQTVKAVWRRSRDQGIYESVRVTLARNFRSEYELARQGIE